MIVKHILAPGIYSSPNKKFPFDLSWLQLQFRFDTVSEIKKSQEKITKFITVWLSQPVFGYNHICVVISDMENPTAASCFFNLARFSISSVIMVVRLRHTP